MRKALKWGFLFFHTLIIILPFMLLVLTALKTPVEFSRNPIGLPVQATFENFREVFVRGKIPKSFFTSVIILTGSVAGQVLAASLSAYALTKMNFSRSVFFQRIFLIPMVFSIQTVVVPLFVLYRVTGLLNSVPGLILIHIATGLSTAIFILTKFMAGIPKEISEAAAIDGAGHFQNFFRIVLPLVSPAIVTVMILNGLGVWNDFYVSYMFFTDGKLTTLPLSIYQFMQTYNSQWVMIAADIIYCIIPILIIYLVLQKYIIEGVAAGSVKG
ncbi:MAG: carbohydrate ABC transporter permease [Lachnospiraceae bacterium]|jgi:raffinose/stachyose/melibiose transport system permease protein|nr:carbohydrate ABC transporter permease [Lachnospiraceae bacterium]